MLLKCSFVAHTSVNVLLEKEGNMLEFIHVFLLFTVSNIPLHEWNVLLPETFAILHTIPKRIEEK